MAFEYLIELTTEALKSKQLGFEPIFEAQNKLKALAEDRKYKELLEYLRLLESQNQVELREAIDYVNTLGGRVLSDERALHTRDWEGAVEALKETFGKGRQGIRMLPNGMAYDEVKAVIRDTVDYFFMQDAEEPVLENRFVLPFLISENFEAEGDLIMRFSDVMQDVTLLSVWYETTNKMLVKRIFGEGKITRFDARHYSEPFYQYRFMSDERKEYVIFTKQELPNCRVKIKGMLCGIMDEMRLMTSISTKAQTMRKLAVVFATSIEQQVGSLDLLQFKQVTWGWSHESIATALFGKYRHPLWFEKLVIAWLFSGKFAGYPLHLGIIAQPATGKTTLLENLALRKFKEREIADGTTNTLAYVIPHFGKIAIDPGMFARCNRVCGVDEFFTMLRRNNYNSRDTDADTGLFTSLLDHKERMGGSGKHDGAPIRARAKLFLATNPRYKLKNLAECAQSLNQAFMTRLFWYAQTPQHVAFVQERALKLNAENSELDYPDFDPHFLEAYDFLNSFTIQGIPSERVKAIFERYKPMIPLELQPVYAGRTFHHVLCLIDGVSKANSVFEQRQVFECQEKDIVEAEEIFAIVMASWNESLDLKLMPQWMRKDYLLMGDRLAFDFIEKNPGCSRFDMENAGIKSAGHHLTKLEDVELVRVDKFGDSWQVYPYWFKPANGIEDTGNDVTKPLNS